MDDRFKGAHLAHRNRRQLAPNRGLTPEEESLPDAEDEYDDTLPADLWFRHVPWSADRPR